MIAAITFLARAIWNDIRRPNRAPECEGESISGRNTLNCDGNRPPTPDRVDLLGNAQSATGELSRPRLATTVARELAEVNAMIRAELTGGLR